MGWMLLGMPTMQCPTVQIHQFSTVKDSVLFRYDTSGFLEVLKSRACALTSIGPMLVIVGVGFAISMMCVSLLDA